MSGKFVILSSELRAYLQGWWKEWAGSGLRCSKNFIEGVKDLLDGLNPDGNANEVRIDTVI